MFKPTTISERATEQLRSDIINGIYKSGDRITIKDIAERYNISAIPVREAFQCLNGEKLIELLPYKGAVVLGLSKDYIHDVIEMNAILQGEFIARACHNPPSAELLEEMHRREQAIADLDLEEPRFWDLDAAFHSLFLSNFSNSLAKDLSTKYVQIKSYIGSKYQRFGDQARKDRIVNQHRNLIRLFQAGEEDALRRAVYEHCMEISDVHIMEAMNL